MRTMHAAVVCNAKVPYTKWCESIVSTITTAAEVPVLQFRKLGLEAQMDLGGEVVLTDDEVAEVRPPLHRPFFENVNRAKATSPPSQSF